MVSTMSLLSISWTLSSKCVAFVVNLVATNVYELSTYVNVLSIKGTSLSFGINLNLAAERTMQDATRILNYKMSSFVTIWRQTALDLLSRSCIEYRLTNILIRSFKLNCNTIGIFAEILWFYFWIPLVITISVRLLLRIRERGVHVPSVMPLLGVDGDLLELEDY